MQESVSRGRGRPREFDIEEALDKAIFVFREKGYHATSISNLANAMDLAPGSIYKAFNDKRAVFLAALDRYITTRHRELKQRLGTKNSGRDRVRELLDFYVESSSGIEGRRGCLIVGSAVEISIFDKEIIDYISLALKRIETLLVDLIQQGQIDGSISSHVDRVVTSRLLVCVLQGMRVVGKTGKTKQEMLSIVDNVMNMLN